MHNLCARNSETADSLTKMHQLTTGDFIHPLEPCEALSLWMDVLDWTSFGLLNIIKLGEPGLFYIYIFYITPMDSSEKINAYN